MVNGCISPTTDRDDSMKKFLIIALALAAAAWTPLRAQVSIATVSSRLTVTPAGGSIEVSNVDCDVTNVLRGVAYTVIFDASSGASVITPSDNDETTTDLGADISSDADQSVLVSFTLPTFLAGTAGVIPVYFGGTSGVRLEDGQLFNPNIPNVFQSGSAGLISLRLGFSFTVPVAALSGDTYTASILTTASYTGGS